MRRQARELALQILFQLEFTPDLQVGELLDLVGQSTSREAIQYAQTIVNGVQKHKAEIDAVIQSASVHWKVERMAMVDRNLLRLAVFEMRFASEILKPSIVINECVEIAKKFGTTDSAAFINGVLDQIAKESP